MLEKIPELFGRTFAVGFLLPSIVFSIAIGATFSDGFAAVAGLPNFHVKQMFDNKETVLFVAGSVLVVSWVLAVLLLALNRTLIRCLEGYGAFNPLKVFAFVERWSFRRRSEELERLKSQCSGEHVPAGILDKLRERWIYMVSHFPEKESLLLATRFGNTLRAYESYSRQMFGFDLIPGWYRLVAFIPKEYEDAMNDAKALMDFWVNLLFLSGLFLGAMCSGMSVHQEFLVWPPPRPTDILFIGTLIVMAVSYNRSISAAVERGEHYKGAVDAYLPKLYGRVRRYDRRGHTTERDFWKRYSQAIAFHAPFTLESEDPLTPSRPATESDAFMGPGRPPSDASSAGAPTEAEGRSVGW